MSQDLYFKQNENRLYDLVVNENDFQKVDGLQTAILVSLFTDKRAPASSVLDPARRRGWVGNILTAQSGRELGSLLWLYEQSRLTIDIRNAVIAETRAALNWLIEDGIALSVKVNLLDEAETGISLLIDIVSPNGDVRNYSVLWRNTNAAGF